MLQTNVNIEENEEVFQEAQKVGDYDTMWSCVFAACYNIAKSIYKKRGYIASEDELYDKSMNGCCMVMRNILERGVKINKLSSYVYTRVFCYIQGYQEDRLSIKLSQRLSNINDGHLQEYLDDLMEND